MATKTTNTPAQADKEAGNKSAMVAAARQEAMEHDIRTLKDQQKIMTLERFLEASKTQRQKYDWEWMIRDLFIRGYQFARYNRTTNTFVFSSKTNVRIPINLVYAQMRVIRNQVTSFRPKWEVMPRYSTEGSIRNAELTTSILDYLWDKLNLRKKTKEAVMQALKFSVGFWEIGFDPLADGGEGEVDIKMVDPFDLYIDPTATAIEEAEYIIKAVRVPIDEVRKNPRYNDMKYVLKPTSQMSLSEYKTFLMQSVRNVDTSATYMDAVPGVILKEAWVKQRDETGKVKMNVTTYADNYVLREDVYDMDFFPWEVYQGDMSPMEIYSESWSKHVIAVNRVINALESHIFEYNHLFARGRFVIDKNSGVRTITNEHGQIIEKNRGAEVTNLPIYPLPETPFKQLENMRRYLEDIGGAHDVSLGRIPTGVKSGVGIAELRQADATNQDDLVDNLEDFLVNVSKKVLKVIARNYKSSKLIRFSNKGQGLNYFLAIGNSAGVSGKLKSKDGKKLPTMKVGSEDFPVVVIGDENEVRVTIGSWLAYTKEAKQEQLKDLFRIGAIDQKTLLENMEFGKIDDVVKRTRMEAVLAQKRSKPAFGAGKDAGRLNDEQLAMAENELLLEEKAQPVSIDDDHEVHLAIHQEIASKVKGTAAELYVDHVQEHMDYLDAQQAGNTAAAGGPMPGGPPVGPEGAPSAGPPSGAPGEGMPPELIAAMQAAGAGGAPPNGMTGPGGPPPQMGGVQ